MKFNRRQIAFSLIILVFAATAALMYYYFYESRIGPEQPIPFSHRLHVNEKKISCFMCHEGAVNSARAGIPPLETCLLCHDHIIIHHPDIENLREHFATNTPVVWKKIYDVPDFVFFNHSVHMFRKIDCARCHGNVKQMDRIEQVQELKMGFCVDCHKDNQATTDCFTCHR